MKRILVNLRLTCQAQEKSRFRNGHFMPFCRKLTAIAPSIQQERNSHTHLFRRSRNNYFCDLT
jgi:hypothetical protein